MQFRVERCGGRQEVPAATTMKQAAAAVAADDHPGRQPPRFPAGIAYNLDLMGRRRPTDFVSWSLYRRAWALPVLALVVLLATSFQPDAPVAGTLPPTLANEQAGELLERSRAFSKQFPDRRPGSQGAGAVDSAQWMKDEFAALDLTARTVPGTTIDPRTGDSVGTINVEATLAGRTRELVVVVAHRDTADAEGRGGDAAGQMALLALAKELAATRDLRRSYLFVSSDAATLNGGGARSLAQRLADRGGVVAVIVIDRFGAGAKLRVDASPSGRFAPPLGLVEAARSAVAAEGGSDSTGSSIAQLARLAVPLTLHEHGQLVERGLPALTITAGDDQLGTSGDDDATAATIGAGLRSVQRLVGTLDQVDRLQSAGKTWVASSQRVYRGWALKILVAALLIPAWVATVDLLVRHRRGWNLLAAIGSVARVMLAGMTAVVAAWLLGAVGLLPQTGDRPPNPGTLDDVHWIGVALWLSICVGAWLLARGPDWRRQRYQARAVGSADTPELVLGLVALIVVSVLALAVSPFAVLFAAPALPTWLLLASRRIYSRRAVVAVWSLGFVGPVAALFVAGARADTGLGSLWYALSLLQTQTVPPLLALLIGAGAGLSGMLLVAALGLVAHPALPTLRARARGLRGHSPLQLVRTATADLQLPSTARLRLPRRSTTTSRSQQAEAARASEQLSPRARMRAREAERTRERERRANRSRVNSR
jgi:hypothetical protein